MSAKIDVRILKTKERLKNALLTSLKEKKLEDITISEICLKASVNRNTFYSHYESVQDLLDEVEAHFLEVVLSKINIDANVTKSVEELLVQILSSLVENKEMCQLLFTENGDKNFMKKILMFALPSAVKNWCDELGMQEDKATKLYYFIIGGAINVIEEWVHENFKDTPEDLAKDLNELIMKGQSAFL